MYYIENWTNFGFFLFTSLDGGCLCRFQLVKTLFRRYVKAEAKAKKGNLSNYIFIDSYGKDRKNIITIYKFALVIIYILLYNIIYISCDIIVIL